MSKGGFGTQTRFLFLVLFRIASKIVNRFTSHGTSTPSNRKRTAYSAKNDILSNLL